MTNNKSPENGESLFAPYFPTYDNLSIKQVKVKSGLGHTKIYAEIRNGRLKTFKCGRRRLVTVEQYLEWQTTLIHETAIAEAVLEAKSIRHGKIKLFDKAVDLGEERNNDN